MSCPLSKGFIVGCAVGSFWGIINCLFNRSGNVIYSKHRLKVLKARKEAFTQLKAFRTGWALNRLFHRDRKASGEAWTLSRAFRRTSRLTQSDSKPVVHLHWLWNGKRFTTQKPWKQGFLYQFCFPSTKHIPQCIQHVPATDLHHLASYTCRHQAPMRCQQLLYYILHTRTLTPNAPFHNLNIRSSHTHSVLTAVSSHPMPGAAVSMLSAGVWILVWVSPKSPCVRSLLHSLALIVNR